ncbi:MAG: hypothetical protein V4616_04605 [Bacteroidota bacterium]
MNQLTAKIISYVFSPLAMPFFSILLAFTVDPYLASYFTPESKLAIYSVMVLNTFLVPTLLILYLKRLGVISSLDVEKRRERFIPFLVTLVLYTTTYFLLRKSPLPDVVYSMVLACILALIGAFIITLFWKISIHMTGIGGVIGAMCALFEAHMFFPSGILVGLILLAGFIGTARLILNVHTLGQVCCGVLLGFFTQFLTIKYGLVI